MFKKKLFIQFLLIVIVIILCIVFYVKFFETEKNIQSKSNEEKTVSNQNIINDIRYQSTDNNNNTYLINAKSGTTITNNPNLIELKDVNAVIKFDGEEQIVIYSKFAIYDQENYDTIFKEKVNVVYNEHSINCEKLNILFTKDLAILNGNIEYSNLETKMFADEMEINLISRTTKIYMLNKNDKIKVLHLNKNGSNQKIQN